MSRQVGRKGGKICRTESKSMNNLMIPCYMTFMFPPKLKKKTMMLGISGTPLFIDLFTRSWVAMEECRILTWEKEKNKPSALSCRDYNEYCKFLHNHKHNMGGCVTLKDQIEEVMRLKKILTIF